MVEEDTPNIVYWLVAWVLYLLGDLAFRLYEVAGQTDPLWRAYQKLMHWSSDVQGESTFGPWDKIEEA